MNDKDQIGRGFLHALGVLAYTTGVVFLIANAEKTFGQEESIFIPLFMLLLFIVSATVTALLVLGRPIQLYLNNAKREAVYLLTATLAWLILFAVLVGLVLAFF